MKNILKPDSVVVSEKLITVGTSSSEKSENKQYAETYDAPDILESDIDQNEYNDNHADDKPSIHHGHSSVDNEDAAVDDMSTSNIGNAKTEADHVDDRAESHDTLLTEQPSVNNVVDSDIENTGTAVDEATEDVPSDIEEDVNKIVENQDPSANYVAEDAIVGMDGEDHHGGINDMESHLDTNADAYVDADANGAANDMSASDARISALESENKALTAKIQELENSQVEIGDLKQQLTDEAAQMRQQTEMELEQIREEARKDGYEEGRAAGTQSAHEDLVLAIDRVRKIASAILAKRTGIILEAEDQIINLIRLIARKVVRVFVEEHKGVVVENVRQALNQAGKSSAITIRINPEDFQVNEQMLNEIANEFEKQGVINFHEDIAIDKGGVIVETDFGQIDSRISTQLQEIENALQSTG